MTHGDELQLVDPRQPQGSAASEILFCETLPKTTQEWTTLLSKAARDTVIVSSIVPQARRAAWQLVQERPHLRDLFVKPAAMQTDVGHLEIDDIDEDLAIKNFEAFISHAPDGRLLLTEIFNAHDKKYASVPGGVASPDASAPVRCEIKMERLIREVPSRNVDETDSSFLQRVAGQQWICRLMSIVYTEIAHNFEDPRVPGSGAFPPIIDWSLSSVLGSLAPRGTYLPNQEDHIDALLKSVPLALSGLGNISSSECTLGLVENS